MRQLWHDYLVLFAMVNAVGNLPIFSDLTHAMRPEERSKTFRTAVATGGLIVLIFALFGNWLIRNVFEVDVADFRIAGGIIMFAISARGVVLGLPQLRDRVEDYEHVAIFPLGFPFLAGPGTIVTTILLFQGGANFVTLGAAVLVYLTILPLLHAATLVERTIGRVGVMVMTRLLYILIAAKAVDFIVTGIRMSLSREL